MDTERMNIRKTLANALIDLGWSPTDGVNPYYAAHRDYDTAVGPKQAFVMLQRTGAHSYRMVGEYQSEGRNALSTTSIEISGDMDEHALRDAAKRFVTAADAVIDETYARGLLLSRRSRKSHQEA